MITSSIFVRLSRIPPRRALFSFLLFLLVAQLITWTLLPDHIKEYPLRWLSRLGQYAEAAEPIDENLLQNVDNQTQITLSQFRLNRVTKKYYGTATITNTSSSDLPKPIYLVVNSTVPDSVKVTNHHGVTIVSNKPYYDISSLIEGDKLAASAITKPLTLEMTNPQNVQFKIYLSVYILAAGHPPVAIPGGPYFGEAGVPIGFDGSASTDPDGDILTYEWTFGDGATETRPNPTHVYATAGIYTVRLTVNDGHEGINTAETTATVTGHPAISVAPQALAFGTVQVGSSKDELLTFSNTGTDTLTITSITSDNEVFSVPQVQEFNIAVGGKPVVVPVKFTPNMDGDHSGVITITSNDPNASSTTVSASGYGIAPAQPPNIVVSPAELSFGDTFLSSSQDMELTITNSGEGLLSVSDIASDNPDFSVMPPALFDIQSNGTPRKVAIRFNPSTLGLVSGNITITSDDPDTAQVTIPVSGNGIQSVQPPDILVSPNSLAFGNVFLEASSVKNVSIANEGEGILTVSSAELDNASASEYKIMNTFPITIAPGKAPVNLSVEYKPLASGQAPDVNLLIDSDDPDEPQITVPLSGNGVEPVKVIEGAPEPPLNAQVVPTNNLNPNNVINAESQFDVHVLVTLKSPAAESISVIVDLVDTLDKSVTSSSFNVPNGQQTVIVTGMDASSLLDGTITVLATAANSFGSSNPAIGEQAVKRTSTLPPPVVDPTDRATTSLSVHITGSSQAGTLIRIEGGASTGTQQLNPDETRFDILIPLKQNSDNTLIVSASDGVDTASANPFTITQIVPSGLVIAKAEARPLTVEETIQLVEKNVIDLDDPANFNVSMFTIVANVGGKESPPITITQPVVIPTEPGISFGLDQTQWIPSSWDGYTGPWEPGDIPQLEFPAEIFVIRTPGGEVIPGVIIIDGRIKTLKEFFQVTIYIMNTSERFTLADVVAKLAPKAGLTPIRVGLGTDVSNVNLGNDVDTVELGDILPKSDATGQFIVRGDQVGLHEVTVNFSGAFIHELLPDPVPVSGSARTSLQVLGPPKLDVVVRHPQSVEKNEIYTMEIEITNRSQTPALYSSLEVGLGGGVQLIDSSNNPIVPPAVVSLGHISPGQTVKNSFRARALIQGNVLAAQAVASENIQLSVFIGVSCPIGYIPAAYQPPEEDAPPTLLSISPKNNAVNVSVNTPIMAILTGQVTNITSDKFTNYVIDPNDTARIISAKFVQGGTFYMEQLAPDGSVVCRIPTDLTVTPGIDNDTTIAVLRPGKGSGTGVGDLMYVLKGNTRYRVTLVGGASGIRNSISNAPFGSTYLWIFNTELVDDMIPPTVKAVRPLNNTTDVALNTSVVIDFSEPMEVSSFRSYPDNPMNSTFGIFDGNAITGGTVRFNADLTQLTFTPSPALRAGRTYIVRLTSGITDKFGDYLRNVFTSSFSTIPADVTPPPAPVVNPVPKLTNVGTLYVTGECEPGANVMISGGSSIAQARAGGTGSFSVPVYLLASAIHTLIVKAVDASGNTSPEVSVDRNGQPLIVQSDRVSPGISSINILPNTTDVPLNTSVSVKFTEDINPDSVNSLNFNLIGDGKTVSGDFSMSGTNGFVFTPKAPLATSTVYNIRLRGGGIRDIAGNGLDRESIIAFRTVLAAPTISGILPNAGIQGKFVDAVITGSNFAEASIVFSNADMAIAIRPGSTSTTIPIRITIGDFAAAGTYYFTITTPKGQANSQDMGIGFSVLQAPPPNITSISPDSGIPGTSLIADIKGSDFRGGFTVAFGADIVVEQTQYVSSSFIQARITIPVNASIGSRTVTVTNIDSQSDDTSFSVLAIPKPVIAKLTPTKGVQGTTFQALIDGQYLIDAVPGADNSGIVVTRQQGTILQLLIEMSIGASVPVGNYNIFVTTPGGQSNSLAFLVLDNDASADSDTDGMPDNFELVNSLDPHNPNDANQDGDSDGLNNLTEYKIGTSPLKADTDGDGKKDGEEVAIGTDPAKADNWSNLVIDGRTVTLEGVQNFTSLTLLNGGILTCPLATDSKASKLTLNITGTLKIDDISKIDVSGKGYPGGSQTGDLRGRTIGNTTEGGSAEDAGGSYGGLGGGESNKVYGDMMNPSLPGSGGGGREGAGSGGSGGGLVTIAANRIELYGSIEANGGSTEAGGGGSGGSVNITVNTLTGYGKILAKGGAGASGGGGGRIAIKHRDISGYNVNNIDSSGGAGTAGNGGAGTIFMKGATQQYGDLLIDNRGVETTRLSTPLRSIGSGSVGGLTSGTLIDLNADFAIPNSATGALGLAGLRINPNINQSRSFLVINNDKTSMTIDSGAGDMTTVAKLGDTYAGEYFFNRITVRGAAKASADDSIFVLDNLTITGDSELSGRVVALTPYIRSLSRYQGAIGSGITIYGEGFSSDLSGNDVSFNGAQATVITASINKLSVRIPSGATSGNLTVTIGWRQSNAISFEIVAEENIPPVIKSSPITTATEGAAYTYKVESEDQNGDIIMFSLSTSPDGMTISQNTGEIRWTPSSIQAGSHEVQVNADDGRGGITSQTYTIIVKEAINNAPIITTQPDSLTGTEGQEYTYNVDATDADNDTLTYSLPTRPTGMQILSDTGIISWTPSPTQSGKHNVTVRASDNRGGTASQSFILDIAETINVAPVITSTSPKTILTEGEAYTYDVEATDGDNDTLAYTLIAPPSGMTINEANGIIDWTPAHEQIGIHQVKVQVDDKKGGIATQEFNLTVEEINQPPEITSSPITIGREGELYSYPVLASDPNMVDTLKFQLIVKPEGMTIDENTGVITWTPSSAQAGSHNVTVKVTDLKEASDSQDFTIDVAEALNNPPEITSNPVTTIRAYSQSKALYLFDEGSGTTAYDSSDNNHDCTISGATYTTETPFSYTGNTALSFDGVNDSVRKNGDNSYFLDSAEGTYKAWIMRSAIEAKRQPIISKHQVSYAGIILTIDSTGALRLSYHRGPSNSWTAWCDLVSVPLSWEVGKWYHIAGTRGSSGMKIYRDGVLVASNTITYPFAEYEHGYLEIGSLSSYPSMYPPFNGLIDEAAIYDQALTIEEIIYNMAHSHHESRGSIYMYKVQATDPDEDKLTYSLTEFPDGMTIDADTGLITWTPSETQIGTHNVTVKVIDSKGVSNSQSFAVNITEAGNNPPTISSTPILTAAPHIRQDALYLMDEASGMTAYNSSSDSYHGTIYGAAYTADAPLVYTGNNALSFDGVDDYVNLGTEISAKIPDAFTLSAWIRLAGTGGYQTIISTYDYRNNGAVGTSYRDWRGFWFAVRDNKAYLEIWSRLGTRTGGYDLVWGKTNINDGNWHHIATVAPNDGVNRVSVFVDGMLDTDYNGGTPCDYDYSSIEMNIGRLTPNQVAGASSYFSGSIDEVAIYSRMLTPTEIAYDAEHSLRESTYLYKVEASDLDGDTLTYSLTEYPEGMTINPTTGLIIWTPASTQVGSHNVTVQVSDSKGGTASQPFTVQVQQPSTNKDPRITSSPVTIGKEGELYSYDVNAEDDDGDTLTYRLTTFPEGMTIDGNTGQISWTPSGTQSGSHNVVVEVSDGKGGVAEQAFTIQVEAVSVFTDVGPGAGVDDNGRGHGAAWGDYDNDGDPDLYLANFSSANCLYRNNGDGTFTDVAASAGVNDNGAGMGVAWGDYDNDGNLDIYLTNSGISRLYRNNGDGTFTDMAVSAGVNNNGDSRSASWGDYDGDGDIDLYLVNNGSANRLYRNNEDGTFTDVAASAGMADAGPGQGAAWADYDRDGDLDLYLARNDSPNILYQNNGDGTFTDVAASAGVNDNGNARGIAWGDFDRDMTLDLYLTNANSANCLYRNNGDGTFTDIAAIAGVDDTGMGHGVTWIDYDNDGRLDLYIANHGPNKLYHNDGVSFTDVSADAGLDDQGMGIGIACADYDNDGDLDIYLVNDGTPNRLFRNDQNDQNYLFVRPLDAQGRFNCHGASVEIFLSFKMDLMGRRIIDSGGGYLSQNAYNAHFGLPATSTYDISVTFPGGAVVTLSNIRPADTHLVEIRQPSTNKDPRITSLPITIGKEGELYSYDVNAEDDDGDTLLYELTTFPEDMTIDGNTGQISWTPSGTQSGDNNVVVEVSDNKGGKATQPFTIAVEEAINTPPTITSVPPTTAKEGEQYTYPVVASDADGDSLFFFLTESPESMTMDSNTGIITWIPSGKDSGIHIVTIAISDGRSGEAEQSYIIYVEEAVNNPPVIISIPPTIATSGILYTYWMEATDEDDDRLTYNAVTGPLGMVIDANFGLISWQPWGTTNQNVSLTVSDDKGGVATQEFNIKMNAIPIITSTPNTSAAEGELYTYDVNAEDADAETLTFKLISSPLGMTIDEATGLITWTPLATHSGKHTVTVQVSDEYGGINEQTFTIEVAEAINVNPRIISQPEPEAYNNSLYVYDVDASDADGDRLSFSLIASPVGMKIDSSTGLVSWTPSGLQTGIHSVMVQVSDGRGGTNTQSFSIKVRFNTGPSIKSVPSRTTIVGSSYSYSVNAEDPEGGTLTYTLVNAPVGMTIDPNTGLITWSPLSADAGIYKITVMVTDERGVTTSQNYNLTVLAVNAIPQIDTFVTGPDDSGVFTYQYQISNGIDAPAAIYDIFMPLTAPILNITVPNGWDYITDKIRFVHIFSTHSQFDVPAGSVLSGFAVTGTTGPNDVDSHILNANGNLFSFTIKGP